MAETILATALERQVWITKYFQEYVRTSRFMPYMSNSDINKGGIILTKFQREDEAFRTINIPFIGRLKSQGITGAQVLDGAEEELTNFNCPITIDWRRNAVRLPKSTTFRTEVNLWDAAKDALLVWETEKLRDDIIHALCMCVVDTAGAIAFYDQATVAQQNTWCAANSDRILFGGNVTNFSGTLATGLGNVATTQTGLGRHGVEGQADGQAGRPAHPAVPGRGRRRAGILRTVLRLPHFPRPETRFKHRRRQLQRPGP
jgi:hypothetical protein